MWTRIKDVPQGEVALACFHKITAARMAEPARHEVGEWVFRNGETATGRGLIPFAVKPLDDGSMYPPHWNDRAG